MLNQVFAVAHPPRARRQACAKRCSIVALAANVGPARVLQVLRLLRQLEPEPALARRARHAARRPLGRAAGRDLLLHVHGDQLHRRRLPRRLRAGLAREVRRLPLLLPAPRRRADRPAGRADPAVRLAARPAARRHEPRLLPDRDGPVQEGRDRELPRGEHRRRGLRRADAGTRRSRSSSASTRTRSRSTPTSPATPTSRSASRCCSGSSSRRTSTPRTRAVSLQDFWRRWHMTLSRWLRDYVYIPLGGSRGGELLTYRNLMLTMLIGGLWHGAAGRSSPGGRSTESGLVSERWWRTRPGYVAPPDTAPAPRVAPLADVPFRLLRLDLLPRRLVRDRLPSCCAASSPAGASRRRSSPRACCSRSPSGSDRSTCRPASRSRHRAFLAPARARAGGCPRARPDAHARHGPGGRRPLHLLPVLMTRPRRTRTEDGRRLASAGMPCS